MPGQRGTDRTASRGRPRNMVVRLTLTNWDMVNAADDEPHRETHLFGPFTFDSAMAHRNEWRAALDVAPMPGRIDATVEIEGVLNRTRFGEMLRQSVTDVLAGPDPTP